MLSSTSPATVDVSAAATLPPDYAEQIEHNPGYRGLLGRLS